MEIKEDSPIKNYECKNCETIFTVHSAQNIQKVRCCEKPNLVLLSTAFNGDPNEMIQEAYDGIISILDSYMEMPDDQKKMVALWIIGTYFHGNFNTYPFLFINAMRGSGKTRLLKIIAHLSKGSEGQVHTGITQATLFRMLQGQTLVLDELESIANKEKGELREYMNACYKKGGAVQRMKKQKDDWIIEQFHPYKPIAMANINGMDEVLGDRCISFILEKSNNPSKTKKIEDFERNPRFRKLNELLSVVCVGSAGVELSQNIEKNWNEYLDTTYSKLGTHNTYTTYYTYYTHTTPIITTDDKEKREKLIAFIENQEMFQKIDGLGIDGRNLELLFPLLLVAKKVNEKAFEDMLRIGKEMMSTKKDDEIASSFDVIVYEFIASKNNVLGYLPIKELTKDFKTWYGHEDWINEITFGKALKRLNLLLDKKRQAAGILVMVNVAKAKEKLKIFKTEDTTNEKE